MTSIAGERSSQPQLDAAAQSTATEPVLPVPVPTSTSATAAEPVPPVSVPTSALTAPTAATEPVPHVPVQDPTPTTAAGPVPPVPAPTSTFAAPILIQVEEEAHVNVSSIGSFERGDYKRQQCHTMAEIFSLYVEGGHYLKSGQSETGRSKRKEAQGLLTFLIAGDGLELSPVLANFVTKSRFRVDKSVKSHLRVSASGLEFVARDDWIETAELVIQQHKITKVLDFEAAYKKTYDTNVKKLMEALFPSSSSTQGQPAAASTRTTALATSAHGPRPPSPPEMPATGAYGFAGASQIPTSGPYWFAGAQQFPFSIPVPPHPHPTTNPFALPSGGLPYGGYRQQPQVNMQGCTMNNNRTDNRTIYKTVNITKNPKISEKKLADEIFERLQPCFDSQVRETEKVGQNIVDSLQPSLESQTNETKKVGKDVGTMKQQLGKIGESQDEIIKMSAVKPPPADLFQTPASRTKGTRLFDESESDPIPVPDGTSPTKSTPKDRPVSCETGSTPDGSVSFKTGTPKDGPSQTELDPLNLMKTMAIPGLEFHVVENAKKKVWDFRLVPEIIQSLAEKHQNLDFFLFGTLNPSAGGPEQIPTVIVVAAPKGKMPVDLAWKQLENAQGETVKFQNLGWRWQPANTSFKELQGKVFILEVEERFDANWLHTEHSIPWALHPRMLELNAQGKLKVAEATQYHAFNEESGKLEVDENGNPIVVDEFYDHSEKPTEQIEGFCYGYELDDVVHGSPMKRVIKSAVEHHRQRQQARIDYVQKEYPHHVNVLPVAKILPSNAIVSKESTNYVNEYYGNAEITFHRSLDDNGSQNEPIAKKDGSDEKVESTATVGKGTVFEKDIPSNEDGFPQTGDPKKSPSAGDKSGSVLGSMGSDDMEDFAIPPKKDEDQSIAASGHKADTSPTDSINTGVTKTGTTGTIDFQSGKTAEQTGKDKPRGNKEAAATVSTNDENATGEFCLAEGETMDFEFKNKNLVLCGGDRLRMQNTGGGLCGNCGRFGIEKCPQHKLAYKALLRQLRERSTSNR